MILDPLLSFFGLHELSNSLIELDRFCKKMFDTPAKPKEPLPTQCPLRCHRRLIVPWSNTWFDRPSFRDWAGPCRERPPLPTRWS
jgi:hypothetical protein